MNNTTVLNSEEIVNKYFKEHPKTHWKYDDLVYLVSNYHKIDNPTLIKNLNNKYTLHVIKKVRKEIGLKKDNVVFSTKLFERHPEAINFFKTWNPKMAYFLGFIVTNGCVHNNRFSLQLKEEDYYILEKFSYWLFNENIVFIKRRLNNRKTGTVYYNMAHLEFNNKEVIDSLKNLGVHERKTFTVKPPENIPEYCLPYFVMGLIDGDGSIFELNRKAKNGVIYKTLITKYTGNVYMTTFVRDYIKNLFDIDAKLEISNNYTSENKIIYDIRYSGKKNVKILNYLYSFNTEHRLDRKYLAYKNYLKSKE